MTEYEKHIASVLKGIGFKLNPDRENLHHYLVINSKGGTVGHLMVSDKYSTIHNDNCSIIFDFAEIWCHNSGFPFVYGAKLTKGNVHIGSINL